MKTPADIENNRTLSETLLGIPYHPIAQLPTPVDGHEAFARDHGMQAFHVKRDDRTHAYYGGNKVRKLGFLLAHAKENGYRSVMTFGAAGSNHALATAVFAQKLDLRALLVLGPQHNSRHVGANLLGYLKTNATLYPCDWQDTVHTAAQAIHQAWKDDGKPPFIMPPGGSSPLGVMGYVNAALELERQVRDGILPEPDLLYIPSGTMGTCVGLALGLCATKLHTRVLAVRVTKAPYTSTERAHSLFKAANLLLQCHQDTFPLFAWEEARFTLRDDFFGDDYGLFTPEGVAAVAKAQEELGLQLEGTYTGKTFAALLADAAAGRLAGKRVLFWNTYAGDTTPLSASVADGDWHRLPEPLHRYFKEPFQPLDRD